jgi:hypothetical protein
VIDEGNDGPSLKRRKREIPKPSKANVDRVVGTNQEIENKRNSQMSEKVGGNVRIPSH